MRDFLIRIWRKLTRIKICGPFVYIIRYAAGTNVFNILLDFIEIHVCQTSYGESQKYYSENLDRIKKITSWLKDAKSEKTYRNIWKYRITHERKYLRGIVSKDQYFDRSIISFANGECFVDGGAYKGDTVRKFIKILRGDCPKT